MNAPAVETDSWSRRRLIATVLLLLLGQFGFIVWFSRKGPVPGRPKPVPLAYVSSRSTSVPAGVEEPAAFVLPNALGFSGPAWLTVSNLAYDPPPWSDDTRVHPPAIPAPDGSLAQLLNSNAASKVEFSIAPETPFGAPLPLANLLDLADRPSRLTLEGGLADWPLAAPPVLGAIHVNDVLKNSVVIAGVTPQGEVFSAVLQEKSGSPSADAQALAVVRSLHFKTPMSNFLKVSDDFPPALRWGRLVFHWQTVAVPLTNAPAS